MVFVGSPVHSSFITTFDDGPFGSKMKGATFQRRPPRTHGQCTHTLGTKIEKHSKYYFRDQLQMLLGSALCHQNDSRNNFYLEFEILRHGSSLPFGMQCLSS